MFYKIILSCAALFGAAVQAKTGPILVEQPQETIFDTASNLNTVSLNCRATGDEPITYTWTKDGAALSQAGNQRLIITPGQLTITNPDRTTDGGEYVCLAENHVGIVRSLPAELVFAYVDQFQPDASLSTTLDAGQGGCISCNPPPHYPGIVTDWFRSAGGLVNSNDPRLRVMDDGRLCFFYALATDAGEYFCQVKSNVKSEGAVGMRVSPRVTVNVNEGGSPSTSIRIVTENGPKDVATLAGKDIKFECFFYGFESSDEIPRVRWVRTSPPGADLPQGRHLIEENGEVLKIDDVQPEDAGTYRCYIDSLNNGDQAELDVVEAPSWIDEPLGTMKDINTMQEWDVDAESATGYTWYRNGALLDARDRHEFRNNFQTLIISDLVTTDTAMYQCFAGNDHGMIYSAAQLYVRAFPPKFLSPMVHDKPAPLSATVTIVCNVDAAPAPMVTWQRNGQAITDSAHYNLTTDPPNLVIVDVNNADGGTYQCIATNSNGTVSGEGSISIKDKTVITVSPENTLVEVGESATLFCKAVHDPYLELTYLWEHNGVEIDHSDIERYRMTGRDNGNLEIVSAELRDGGEYTCVALTVADSDRSSVTLNIAGPPGPPSGLSVEIDNMAANLRWVPGTDNNSPITSYTIEGQTDHSDEWVEIRTGESEGSTSVRLTDLEAYSLYSFRVIAINRIGDGEPSQHVQATERTGKAAPTKSPMNIGGGGGNQGDLRVTWDLFPTADWNSDTVSYRANWQKVDSQVSLTGEIDGADTTVYVATVGIELYTLYKVRVMATNDIGDGPYSDWAFVYSYQEAPKTAPTGVTAEKASGSSILVSWDAIDESTFQGELMGYKLKYWSDASNEANANTAVSKGVGTSNTIVNLEPDTRYTVMVAAYSGGGNGPDSNTASDTTFKSAPSMQPTGVIGVLSETGVDLKINWNGITTTSSEEPLLGYKVRYRTEGTFAEDAETLVVQGTDETSAEIGDLTTEMTYLITVLGYSDGGNGASSSPPLSITTGKRKTGESSDDGGGRASRTAGVLSFSLVCVATLLHPIFHLL
nr:contactin-2-like [Lytechinus pictus]